MAADTTDAAPVAPRPAPTPAARPFWDALRAHRIELQRCEACITWVHYPRHRCPRCGSSRLGFVGVPDHGRIHSFTVARQATAAPFAAEVPQLIAIVELDCGVRITTTLVTDDPSRLAIGAPVRAEYDDGDDGITLLRFRPTRGVD